jgi:hypothetical protein
MRVVLWNVRITVAGWLRGRTNVNVLKRRWEEGTDPNNSSSTSLKRTWRNSRRTTIDNEIGYSVCSVGLGKFPIP